MPAKRTRSKARAHRVTPEAVRAYQARDWGALHRALGLKPWEASPLDINASENAQRRPKSPWAQSVPQAVELRSELETSSGGEQ